VNGNRAGWCRSGAGFILLLYMMARWFGEVIRESEGGKYGQQEDCRSLGNELFIFSEVMFFGAFSAPFSGADLFRAGPGKHRKQRADVAGVRAPLASAGPAFEEQFKPMGAWASGDQHAAVLSSGVTVTMAHWALRENNRKQLIAFLALTVLLGVRFSASSLGYGHAIRG